MVGLRFIICGAGKGQCGEGLSVFDSIVLVASVRAYGPVGEAIGKHEERVA